jgi:hypothetical protein
MKLSFIQFSPSPVRFLPLRSKHPPHHPILTHSPPSLRERERDEVSLVQDLRFLQRCCSGFRSSGMSCCVIGCLTFEDEDIMFIRNFENHSPNDTASHPRRPESEVCLATILPDFRSNYTLFRKPV